MPVLNRIAGYADEMTDWRRWLHRNPELGFECHKTAAFVAEKLRSFGVDEIHEGIAQTGIVAIVNGQGEGPTMGLRADMDALPMDEITGAEHASEIPGKMHACGHDGHTTMLLGAAKYLAETRRFKGRVALIFQPAEEGGGGGKVMVDEGMMERFGIERVFAIHNSPGDEKGHILTRPGPIMASADEFRVTVKGVGGHAAQPQRCRDPIMAATQMVQAFQTILSRNTTATDQLVISVATINAGTAFNIIPDTCTFSGTVRSFTPEVKEMVIARMQDIVTGTAKAFGVTADLEYLRGYPPTVNDAEQVAFAAAVAADVVGEAAVDTNIEPQMPAEDFSYMLEVRPGAYLNLGQGDTPSCHHPAYDFDDDVTPIGASFFARLVEIGQPV